MIIDIPFPKPGLSPAMIRLTTTAHQWAAQFCNQQRQPLKAEQVYRNTLAVWAVHERLRGEGIATDLAASHSWNLIFQTCSDGADLVLPGQGRLECRPVDQDAAVMLVPPETWEDRLGYVAVQLDDALETATVLGVVETVQQEAVALADLQDFSAWLERLRPQLSFPVSPTLTRLQDWLQGQLDQGWQTLESLLHQPTPALNPRSALVERDRALIRRAKPLALPSLGEAQIVVVVAILPQAEQWQIAVSLGPQPPAKQLPPGLTLSVLDPDGIAVMQAQSRATEQLTLEFTGEPGDRFSVQITLGATTLTEAFEI
jgi:hypothetical protein